MSFHLGKPILVMLIIALITGAFTVTRPWQAKRDFTVWTFDDAHYRTFQRLIPGYEQRSGKSVDVSLVAPQALELRLSSLFMTNPTSPQLPDLVEIEIGWVGKYSRPPIEQMGFIPLNDMLKKSGWYDRIVQQRFAPWTKDDQIFGVPNDVHPVTLTYREDLFRKAGVNLSTVKTWPELHEACLKFDRYWREHGYRQRHAIEAGTGDTTMIQQILLQRHISLIDQDNRVHISDPRVAQTVVFYAQLVAGPKAVGGQSSGTGAFAKDLNEGLVCAFITPDWRIGYLKRYGESLSGLLRMMPLPRFDPQDAPTSTWGGTMIGITKACPHPAEAFKLIDYLYLSDDAMRVRREMTDILPPVMSVWDQPEYHHGDPFFGGQKVQELFIQLAREIPRRYQTPASPLAAGALTLVLNRAVAHLDEHQSADGLESLVQGWLDQAAADLQRRIAHWRFDQ